jgi:membrane protein
LVRTVESSFNLLYQADNPLPWSRIALYFTLLTLGPVALVSAQILQDRLLANLGTFMGGWLAAPFAYVAPLFVSCFVLTLAFRTIPNTWVAWRAAVIGGLWGGLAWFAFQEIFGFYVNHVSMVSLYGALALIPLFLLWIYWSWLIILAGVALSFIVQYLPADEHWARRLLLPSDPRLLVPIMVRVAEAFERGEKLTTARLSLELRVPPRILRPYVRVLESEGYVRGLRDRVDQHVLTLAKPSEAIKVREILELAPPARTPVAADLLEELRRCELDAAGSLTLEELVARSRDESIERPPRELVEENDAPRRGHGAGMPDRDPSVDPRPATER